MKMVASLRIGLYGHKIWSDFLRKKLFKMIITIFQYMRALDNNLAICNESKLLYVQNSMTRN